VEEARRSLEEKAEQLTLTSKYKSEFLANMSHELRTPLNSLLILAQQLYENPEGNLSEKQVRFAKTIHSCGDDLIQLINDILDLSKIESGFITAEFLPVRFREISSFVETTFKPISEAKHLKFNIELEKQLPDIIETDIQRLNQILKNLLSNAFKFTEKGEVKLKIYKANKNWKTRNPNLDNAKNVVGFAISDTGIGISKDKQGIIFEAFQQAEGSTSRKYGGTGLGLSISRGLAELLGGTIELESFVNQGSTFTLFVPLEAIQTEEKGMLNNLLLVDKDPTDLDKSLVKSLTTLSSSNTLLEARHLETVNEMINETGDDRGNIQSQDKVLLVVEDDIRFAKIIIEKAHELEIKVVIATTYSEVFSLVNIYNPIAVTLDIKLPDTSGWKVLDMFKSDLNFRHIPIYLISGEENRMLAYKRGARSFLLKPLKNEDLNMLFKDIQEIDAKRTKNVLLIEDNEMDSSGIVKMLQQNNIKITIADTGKKAVQLLQKKTYDAIVLDYMLPDMSGLELMKKIGTGKNMQVIPFVIYSAKDFSDKEMTQLKQLAKNVILKDVKSLDLLLEEMILQLHIDHKTLPVPQKKLIESIRLKEDVLLGKNILIVDDDVRNLFALTTAFERYNINAITAESGREAINILNDNVQIDMVLMDIMMPEMDGYETTQKIRRENKNSTLPIIAVTAKAMKGDREKCIEAGASDYITKPVKVDQLLSLMRIWLYK
jgi:CheY-like chemotaxis protein/nitrogen-specific signal transduction histidine kinase